MVAKYKKLCNKVKASSRKDRTGLAREQCTHIEKYTEERKTREAFKLMKNINRKWQLKQIAMKNKEVNILMDRMNVYKGG